MVDLEGGDGGRCHLRVVDGEIVVVTTTTTTVVSIVFEGVAVVVVFAGSVSVVSVRIGFAAALVVGCFVVCVVVVVDEMWRR